MSIKLLTLQDDLFSCPFSVIEEVLESGPTATAGNEPSPLRRYHYFEGHWTGSGRSVLQTARFTNCAICSPNSSNGPR